MSQLEKSEILEFESSKSPLTSRSRREYQTQTRISEPSQEKVMGLSVQNLKGIVQKKNLGREGKSHRLKKLNKLKEYLKSTESKEDNLRKSTGPVSEFRLEFKPKTGQSDSVNVLLKRLNNLEHRTMDADTKPRIEEGNRRLSFMRMPEFKESSQSTDNFKTVRRTDRELSEYSQELNCKAPG